MRLYSREQYLIKLSMVELEGKSYPMTSWLYDVALQSHVKSSIRLKNVYHIHSRYSQTKLSRMEEFHNFHGFYFRGCSGPQSYITYIGYKCDIILLLL